MMKSQFPPEVNVVGDYQTDRVAVKRGSGEVIGSITGKKGRGELKAGGSRSDNRYEDERSIRITTTVQGNVRGKEVVEVDSEEEDNGKEREDGSTRKVRLVDKRGSAGRSMEHVLQDHDDEAYLLSLHVTDHEGLEVEVEAYGDRDQDEESEENRAGHGKGVSLRELSEPQSGRGSDLGEDRVYSDGDYKNGANRAKREKNESYNREKEKGKDARVLTRPTKLRPIMTSGSVLYSRRFPELRLW